jgi:AraC-like DNA-binding protein
MMFRPGQAAGGPVKAFAEDLAPGHDTGWHRHQRAQLVMSAAGTLTCETRDGTWVVPPDRAVWIPPGRHHRLSCSGPVAVRALYFKPELWDGGSHCRVLRLEPLLRALILRAAVPPQRGRHGKAAAERRLAVLRDELATAAEASLGLMLGEDPRLRRVTQALVEAPDDNRSLAAWTGVAAASERTLARLFLAETGLAFGQWRRQARLLKSLSLLAAGAPVTAVALDLGYAGPSAFIQAFRRQFGTTPGRHLRVSG